MSSGPKISELKKAEPKLGGGDNGGGVDCFIIEKASNGFILRLLTGGPNPEEGVMEDTLVYTDRSEMLRDLAKYL